MSLCDLLAPPKIIALFSAQKMPLKKRAKLQRREHTLTGMPVARIGKPVYRHGKGRFTFAHPEYASKEAGRTCSTSAALCVIITPPEQSAQPPHPTPIRQAQPSMPCNGATGKQPDKPLPYPRHPHNKTCSPALRQHKQHRASCPTAGSNRRLLLLWCGRSCY